MLDSGVQAMKRTEGTEVYVMTWDSDAERRKYREKVEVQRWLVPEVEARRIERRVQRLRWGRGMKAVVFEKTGVAGWVEEVIGERGERGGY